MQVDQNKVVAVAFIDFRKAFDCVSHTTLLHKLRHQFGFQGPLFSWLTDYLSDLTKFSVVNGQHSNVANVRCGILQGSILGPTQFVLYTNDLPSSVSAGSVFMFADDTTVYCIGDNVDNIVMSLNAALTDLNRWCQDNSLTPPPPPLRKVRSNVIHEKKIMIGPINLVYIGRDRIEWVYHTCLLGITIDDRPSWSQHLTDVKKSFVDTEPPKEEFFLR